MHFVDCKDLYFVVAELALEEELLVDEGGNDSRVLWLDELLRVGTRRGEHEVLNYGFNDCSFEIVLVFHRIQLLL